MFKKLIPALVILTSFLSCQYELLPSPSSNGNSNAAQFNNKGILPPENVTASQGDYRSVTLTWDPVKNATQYQIFSADTEFDTFEKKGETKGSATSFTIQENTGSTKAYYIKSVDYYGNTSRPSFITTGSSLSVPIITDITQNKDGDIYTINWWMSNCSENTYENFISYTINCYEEGVNTPTKVEIPGNLTSYNFTNLKQSTVYKFTIEAYKTGSKQKHEVSDTEPIETGHRIVPDAARNLTVSKGTSTSEMKISFNLPPKIEASTGDGTYLKDNPIYFSLKRKPASVADPEDAANIDSVYTTIYDYIGYNSNSDYAKNAAKKLILSGSYTEDGLVEITETLSTDDRGEKFVYRLQSYTDVNGSTKNMNLTSTTTSVTQDTGWTISQVSFKIEGDNTIESVQIDESTTKQVITNISVDFHISFDNMNIPYSYFLTSQKYTLDNSPVKDGGETIIKKANKIEDLNDYSVYFTSPATQKGYYEYKLYITEPVTGDSIPALKYEVIKSPTRVTVTDDASALPVIKYDTEDTFHVEDGYKDKYILSWNNISDCSYILSWQNKNGDGYTTSKSIGPFTTTDYSEPNNTGTVISNIEIQNEKILVTHSAESGEIRSYTLTAIKGLSNSCEKKEDFYTLGTAIPEMQTPDYDTITVIWDKVQKAKDNITDAYSVTAKYTGDSTNLLNGSNCEITETEDNKIKCVITKPEGYKNATKSGKPIEFTVKTTGENDTTTATEQVYTMGPANLNVIRDPDLFSDHINISWNRVEGAKGYLVYRVFKNNQNQFIKNAGDAYETGDALYVTSNGVYFNGEKINSASSIASAERILFTDSYEYTKLEDAKLDALKKHQIQLTWGLPVSYTVVPVLNESDINFDVTASGITATRKDGSFKYENLSDVVTSTFGYGLNVKASKAESNTIVTITWDQPYNPGNLIPKIYRRKNASADWEVISSPTATSASTMSQTITYGPNETNTYEYAVVYNNSSLDKTYVENLESVMDTNSPSELSNKGYTLSLPQGYISADSAGGYKEKFSWEGSTYDFTKRNNGPDYYEIQILNKNKASGWTTIAKIPIPDKNNNNGKQAQSDYSDTTYVKLVSSNSYQAIFEPEFNADNISIGQMQVLRDYKHYYRLRAVKETNVESPVYGIADIHNATDGSKYTPYAYRQITGEEFIKIGLLHYSYGIYDICNGKKWDSANYTDSTTSPWITSKSWGIITYSFNNYLATYDIPNNETFSGLMKLSSTPSTINAKGTFAVFGYAEDSYTKNIDSITLNITSSGIPDSVKDSYSGSITFETSYNDGNKTQTGSSYLTVSTSKTLKNKTKITCSTSAERRNWLPLMMNNDSEWYMWFKDTADTKYYWWDTATPSQGGN